MDQQAQLVESIVEELRHSYLPDRTVIGALSTHLLLYADLLTQDSDGESLIDYTQHAAPEVHEVYFAQPTGLNMFLNNYVLVNQVAIVNILMHLCRDTGVYQFNELQRRALSLIRHAENAIDANVTLNRAIESYVEVFYASRAQVLGNDEVRILYDSLPLANPQPMLFPQILTDKGQSRRFLFGERE